MNYINNSSELTKEFKRLLTSYDNYHWMVAWAGDSFHLTSLLSENADKIKQLVVGLHFYQTHPSFVEEFNPHQSVRFIKTTSGIFHSKVYLFSNNNQDWELLDGSSNFTNAGFNMNNEASILIKSNNSNNHLYANVIASISDSWNQAKKFTDEELADYRISWQNQKSKIDSLSGYKRKQNQKQFYQIPIVKMTWRQYMNRINQMNQDIDERISVLDIIQEHFINYPVFADMPALNRKQVCGYIFKGQEVDFRLFGNMLNATSFTHLVNTNPLPISRALDQIPMTGIVTKRQYESFVELFVAALDGGNKYRSATRLLAMKRPDIFFGLSKGNNLRLASDFDIEGITTINLKRYWEEVVLRIYDSDWWQNPQPKNKTERKIANYRAAFMDAMYYNPSDK